MDQEVEYSGKKNGITIPTLQWVKEYNLKNQKNSHSDLAMGQTVQQYEKKQQIPFRFSHGLNSATI